MGYTRIVQYGDIVERYEYEKNRTTPKKPFISAIAKNRAKKIRELKKRTNTYKKTNRSILRCTTNFFNLCHHNNTMAHTVTFLTITFAYDLTFSKAGRYVARFMERIKSNYPEIPISYISVSELTKAGRYHFHLLVYDLPPETAKRERETRNFQRLFERGYIDLCFAETVTTGIAGYMAKYMAKTLRDAPNETNRGYNASRNIRRPFYAGSNTLNTYTDLIYDPSDIVESKKTEYNVPYLGKCIKTRNKIKLCKISEQLK